MNRNDARIKERINTYLTNISILLIYTSLIYFLGIQAFLLIQLPILFIAGSLGIWLFYVQHQFEDSYFEEDSKWSFVKAAVDGRDRKSTRLNSSHVAISYAVFCL